MSKQSGIAWMKLARAGWVPLLGMLVLGCSGSSGPPRYPVEGSVTYDGKPVPAGQIVFEPDSTAGNQGPASYATIDHGRFATPRGKGTVGGPHRVRITGTDGQASGESPHGSIAQGHEMWTHPG